MGITLTFSDGSQASAGLTSAGLTSITDGPDFSIRTHVRASHAARIVRRQRLVHAGGVPAQERWRAGCVRRRAVGRLGGSTAREVSGGASCRLPVACVGSAGVWCHHAAQLLRQPSSSAVLSSHAWLLVPRVHDDWAPQEFGAITRLEVSPFPYDPQQAAGNANLHVYVRYLAWGVDTMQMVSESVADARLHRRVLRNGRRGGEKRSRLWPPSSPGAGRVTCAVEGENRRPPTTQPLVAT